jgi:hypothetical protein
MPQQGTSGEPPERRYDETVAPQNPPNSVLRPAVRRATLATYLGGLILVFAIAAGALVYFTVIDKRDDAGRADPTAVGTSGERMPREGTPGGFDPAPSFGNTADELEYRGGGADRVTLDDVQVERADGDTFWVRSDNRSVAIVAPGGMPTVRAGQRVDVTGTRQSDGRIRASRIDVN